MYVNEHSIIIFQTVIKSQTIYRIRDAMFNLSWRSRGFTELQKRFPCFSILVFMVIKSANPEKISSYPTAALASF